MNKSDPSGLCLEDACVVEGVIVAGIIAEEAPVIESELPVIEQEATGFIYWAKDTLSNPTYIGKTVDFARRAYQHLHGPAQRTIVQIKGLNSIPKQYLRATEQALIEWARDHGYKLDNMRNAASPQSDYYKQYINIGREYIKKAGFD